jgi:hypothetical protein
MLRSLIRTGVLALALGAALVFSGSALANPTTPQLHPIAPTVFAGPLTVQWNPSTFDANAIVKFYELQVIDFTSGTAPKYGVFGTSKTINVIAGHTYGLRLRAAEVANGQLLYSGSSVDVFNVIPMIIIPDFYEVEYKWPPDWPWCLTCPPFDVVFDDDPVVQRQRELILSARVYDREVITSLYVDARGEVTARYG